MSEMTIVLKKLTVEKGFSTLWFYNITGLKLDKHCQDGFLGKCIVTGEVYEKFVNKGVCDFPFTSKNGLYYLCGVAKPFNWEKNFHCPFMFAEGERFEYESNGVTVELENAKRIPIVEVNRATCPFPGKDDKQYYTCRNWQFANMLVEGQVEGYRAEHVEGYRYKVYLKE